jgi:hypothetical protein
MTMEIPVVAFKIQAMAVAGGLLVIPPQEMKVRFWHSFGRVASLFI